jgi:hypothetical protein
MKKGKKVGKLVIKKVTLKDLDETTLDGMAGGTVTKIKTACGPASLCTAARGIACC